MSGALSSASCDITHETSGTICYGHWVLRLVISHTRQGVRFVTGVGFCGGKSFYGYWVLRLVITHTRQGGTILTGIGFCVL